MKNFVTFDNAKEMLNFINDDHDLYCAETNTYVANYNSCGGIVTYFLNEDEVCKCEKYREETGDYWLGCLGPGGNIYDDPSYPDFKDGQIGQPIVKFLLIIESCRASLRFVLL